MKYKDIEPTYPENYESRIERKINYLIQKLDSEEKTYKDGLREVIDFLKTEEADNSMFYSCESGVSPKEWAEYLEIIFSKELV